ncbi:ABC transporter permease [Microbacterium sp. STN6]|uniref:methionine ABC transporter permease n=1 Tax=Microbacterium sp. STN6 TaxID=2995588 RepID=UPI002260BA6A|nr:methionine ABC transporter permease [Microbacterium sp. STN6]MCX7521793.1 ABC transporter permease [Microbacterium sp. STN6]
MNDFIDNLPLFFQSIWETIYIVVISLVASGVLGLALGVGLTVTRPGHLVARRAVHVSLNVIVNIVRPVPFIIFAAAIGPLTMLAVHTTIGNTAVIFALSLAATFAVARIVEQNLLTVDPGVIEAARAMGASPWNIILRVLIPEGLGPLVLGYTFLFVGIVDMSAQAALIGGGGLGTFAIVYGYQRFNWPVVYFSVAAIIVIVQAGQFFGNWLARRALRR